MATDQPQVGASSWRFLARYWPQVVIGSLVLLVNPTLAVVIPYYIGRAIDVFAGEAVGDTSRLVGLVIVLAIIQTIARSSGFILLQGAARRAEHDLRTRVFERLLRTDAAYLRTQRVGDLASRLSSDLAGVMTMWGMGLLWIIGMGALLVMALVLMVRIDPVLTLWSLLPVPIMMVVTQRLAGRVKRQAGEANRQLGKLSATVTEDLTGIGVVKGYHLEEQRSKQFAELSTQLVRRNMVRQLTEGLFLPILGTLTAASRLAVLWLGGMAVIDGDIRLGEFIQFTAYLVLISMRVVGLAGIVSMFQQGGASWARITAVLARSPKIEDGTGEPLARPIRGELELRNLTVELDGRRILDGVSLKIPARTITAVVGRVGSGKTTLLEAIPRILDTPADSVLVDGRDITELPLADLRGAIAYASQNAFLFSASIADNIAFGLDGTGDRRERVLAAARVAGLEPDLAALPQGIDTPIGERGIGLSGGQRQRVALARAIASDRPIILLDDSLSAVDTETERRILDSLAKALDDRTVVLVSHRLAALRRADQIAVLDGGRIVELGHHDELLARGGLYTEIYRAQLESETAA
ncbi:MAG TPA: ABC transporter ATP-binding protein [Kofleriaceae bacterium]